LSFETEKYQIVRNVLSKELTNFIFNYIMLQRDAVNFLLKNTRLDPANPFIGREEREDEQVPGCYTKYADWVMETLLMYMIPIMKGRTGMELAPTYSYTRLYEKGNKLKRHKDRSSCEVSTTLHLGGNEWPIFLDPSGADFVIDELKEIHKPGAPKGIRVDLKAGDMLIYSGCELEHWREPFEGNICAQVFLHYNYAHGPLAKTHLFDKRPMLGVPADECDEYAPRY